MRRMNFRQRVAWLLVAFFLAGSCALVYYIFEISDKFNQAALDHVEKYHSHQNLEGSTDTHGSSVFSVFSHITDIPLVVWLMLFILPYLQIFSMLLACTKPEPRVSMAYLWPFVIYMKCKQLFITPAQAKSSEITVTLLQTVTSLPEANGLPNST